jgi:hypothetical protein
MIELKKEDLRDRLRDASDELGVRFLTDEEVEKKWAESYNNGSISHIRKECEKLSIYGKMHLARIAKETGVELSEIKELYKLQTKDPYQWVYNLVAPKDKDEELEHEELEQWFHDSLIDSDKLRRENKRLREEIKTIKNKEEFTRFESSYESMNNEDKLMTFEDIEKLTQYVFFVDKDGNRRRVKIKTDTIQT